MHIKKTVIDPKTWKRKGHFDFFRDFDDPYFGIMAELDVTHTVNKCKTEGLPVFLYYHHLSARAVHKVDEFRTRIDDNEVVVYDTIHVATTLLRKDKTFSFSFIEFVKEFTEFVRRAEAEIERVMLTTGIGLDANAMRPDAIHYSTVPWIRFTGLTHARKFGQTHGTPKISFGQISEEGGRKVMPVSIYAHHGLMDAWHIGEYLKVFQRLLDGGA